jgi:hypothetical protein
MESVNRSIDDVGSIYNSGNGRRKIEKGFDLLSAGKKNVLHRVLEEL